MGKRGPAPTPTAILQMRGSRVLYDRAKTNEPTPEVGRPAMPALSPEAASVWHQLLPELESLGVLSVIDGRALQRYCELLVDWTEAQAFLREHGPVYETSRGDHRKRPQVSVRDSLTSQLLRLEQEFGLTPSARTRLHVERKEAEKESIGKFLA